MGKILNEKSIDTTIYDNDNAINFIRRGSEPNLDDLLLVKQIDIFNEDEISINKDTINNNFYTQIINVFKKTADIYSDKGINTLFLGCNLVDYEFVDEETKKNVIYSSPTVFYPMKISIVGETVNLSVVKSPVINEKLINFLKTTFPENDFNYDKSTIDPLKFTDMITSSYPKTKKSELYNGRYLGSFNPFEKKLKTEIKLIAQMNIDLFESKPIFSKNDYIYQEFNNEPLLVINNPLNFYQKIAVRSALNENTIIYGPPGTGKSEIIVNIIANAIVNAKKMLIACEKKTALDVLLERLGALDGLCLFLNAIDDEDLVYKKINDIQEGVGATWINEDNEINNKNESYDIRKSIYELNSIKVFTNRTLDFYKKIDDSIDLDKISKTVLDFASYQKETTELKSVFKELKEFDELNEYAKNLDNDISVWNLIMKIRHFIDFKNKFSFDEYLINEYFKQIDEFNKIKYKSLYADKLEKLNDNFNDRFVKFFKLMQSISLEKDKNFYNELVLDYSLFERQMKVMTRIWNSYPKLVEDNEFMKFLIYNSKTHPKFIEAIKQAPDFYKFTCLNNYLETANIKTNGFKIKEFDEEKLKELKEKYEVINLFSLLTLPDNCEYLLNDPNEYWKYLTNDLVYFYLNDKMKSEEMKFLINNQIISVNDHLCDIVTKTKIKEYLPRIQNISDFEEINLKNKMFNNKTMNNYVTSFFKQNQQTIGTISNDIYNHYIEYLKRELKSSSPETKKLAFEMFQVAKLPSNRMKITKFIKKYSSILHKIFPIWIGSPTDVSDYCEFNPKIFDIAIIDESSQMLMENALPILYRCKHYVVAGDDKQLKATVAFAKKYKNLTNIENMEEMDFDIVESLLDRASVALWNNFILRNHYRSRKQELISFSNKYIYNNQLIFASINNDEEHAVEVVNMKDAYYIDSVNEKEAEEAIKILIKNLNKYESFLIITFSANQSEYIQKLMVKSKYANEFNQLISDNKLKVKNLENVQGFEADCVILSVSHGRKDQESKLKSSFGPLIQDGGSNRLNVAITRAKSKMFVIKSFMANEMSINKENKNLMTFYYFIDYLDNLDSYYKSLSQVKQIAEPKHKYGNQIIEYIKPYLDKYKLKYTCDFQLGNFIADIVIYDKNLNYIKLVICLDYWSKYNEPRELLTSINTQEYLMSIGYKFMRIKELEWQFNRSEIEKEIKKIMSW